MKNLKENTEKLIRIKNKLYEVLYGMEEIDFDYRIIEEEIQKIEDEIREHCSGVELVVALSVPMKPCSDPFS